MPSGPTNHMKNNFKNQQKITLIQVNAAKGKKKISR
jgi:hypothetical protein